MGNGVSGLESETEVSKAVSENIRRRPSTTVYSPNVPRDVGSVDAEIMPNPQNLGWRNMSAPEPQVKKITVESNRRKRGSMHRPSKKDDYLMKRYSFMRQGRTSVAQSEGNELGKTSKIIVVDSNLINAIADGNEFELRSQSYTLPQWEEIYKQMSRMYEKLHGQRFNIFDEETINSDEVSSNSYFKAEEENEVKVTKYTLENALDKISRVIENHTLFKKRQEVKWEVWEKKNELKNKTALRQMEAFVPMDIKTISVKDIVQKLGRSWPLAKRLVDKKIFHLLRMSSEDILKVHNTDFAVKGRFDFTDLDLVELRAIYFHTRTLPNVENLKWRQRMRSFLHEYTVKEERGTLSKFIKRHHAYLYKDRKSKAPQVEDEKERLTMAIRAKTKSLLGEIESKSKAKKKEVLTRVQRFTGSAENKYTRMVRRQLSISDTEEEEEDLAESFENFYTTGSFVKTEVSKEDDDSDLDEMDSIERLVQELSTRVSCPEELERLLATVFE